VAEAKRMIAAGEFGEGSIAPKVQAAVSFVGSGGERAVIASLEDATRALAGEAGTTIS
jgi:carbamate kinase